LFYKYPASDVHIHANTLELADMALDMVKKQGYDNFVMQSHNGGFPEYMGNNLLMAYIKLASGGKGYAFAAFHYPEGGPPTARDLLNQAGLYYELGFDGIKMMDGKPNIRKRIGLPLNDPIYDPMLSFLESVNMPLLYHVNDPDEFWDWDRMPEWAKKAGKKYFYGGGDYPSKRQIEDEAVDMLKKHRKLSVIFAHFFFTSGALDRARDYFETFPYLSYDITPGWEMYANFSQNYDECRQFFCDYSHRILFGSDTVSAGWQNTLGDMRRFLETGDKFDHGPYPCRGFALEGAVLRNIYQLNFRRYLKTDPRKMNLPGLRAYGASLVPRDSSGEANIQEALGALERF
jgi:predicted TIM-barrel fold metal-dependent hydrolase